MNDIKLIVVLCRVALKRAEAVGREVMKKFADDKKMSKQEKEERLFVSLIR